MDLKYYMFSESDIKKLKVFEQSVYNNLFENILPFWIKNTQDKINGGFYGRITNDNKIEHKADKSLILHSRILWTFSAVYGLKADSDYLKMADYAYDYLIEKFLDKKYSGMFWMLNYQGDVIDNTKKIYGQAFSIYALAEYYKISKKDNALNLAKEIFQLIEDNNFDQKNTGYYETSHRNWSIAKIALSEVDMNELKSMNTHLHLMEAYINLYQVWPDSNLQQKLRNLIGNFLEHIIDNQRFQLNLFFDEKWNSKSNVVSYGHDIETSWLLKKAVEQIDDEQLREKVEEVAVKMVNTTMAEGFGSNYIIFCEKKPDGTIDKNMDWWQQAEAIVGLINAFQITRNRNYLDYALQCWEAIEKYVINKDHGEWYYKTFSNGTPDLSVFKVSEWKGPYHNSRACLETLKRLEKLEEFNT